ncbi:dihydropteroate synthase [Phycisphaerales bacterium ac7]
MTSGFWQLAGGHRIDLSGARLIGILNITPDSFSDGGRYVEPHHAVERARELIEEGADLLDIGGESTRPGATRVDAKTQIARVVPVIRAVRDHGIDAPISIDTTLAEVAEAAIEAGASIINDVAAGTESESMLDLAARTGAGLVLMHRLREPGSDSFSNAYPKNPEYDHPRGVTGIVSEFLVARAEAALCAGVAPESIVIDPGLGFGKSVAQNYELIARTPDLLALGFPLCPPPVARASSGRSAESNGLQTGSRGAWRCQSPISGWGSGCSGCMTPASTPRRCESPKRWQKRAGNNPGSTGVGLLTGLLFYLFSCGRTAAIGVCRCYTPASTRTTRGRPPQSQKGTIHGLRECARIHRREFQGRSRVRGQARPGRFLGRVVHAVQDALPHDRQARW